MFVWQKKEWFGFLQVQSNLQKRPPLYNGHLSRTNLFFSGQSIHSLLFQPLYTGYLSRMATSLQQPPLHYSHLSTTSFLVDSPYIHSCFNLSTMATSLQRSFFWRTVHTFTLVSTSPQWPPLCNGHFFGGQSIHSLLFQPLHNGHLSTTATSPQRPLPHNGHLSSTVTFPQWPLLHYGHLSTTATFFCPQGGHCREVQL